VLKSNINNALMKFSGHKVIGSSSEEEEESDSDSKINIEFEELDKDEHHEIVKKAEKQME
jgi:hypothetical protein